jgi:hypothetical protein
MNILSHYYMRIVRLVRRSFVQQSSSSRGFTLLLAALVASIVLSLASAIFSIAQKQITLASLSQQSQYAFYTADTAAECALYWDVRFSYFAPATPTLTPPPICDGQVLSVTNTNPGAYPYVMTFQFEPNGNCAQVTVRKCQGLISATGVCTFSANAAISTQISANGFNTSCSTISSSPTALERSVELNF